MLVNAEAGFMKLTVTAAMARLGRVKPVSFTIFTTKRPSERVAEGFQHDVPRASVRAAARRLGLAVRMLRSVDLIDVGIVHGVG